jgi:IclR family KDG regulon transcriptional repressor
MIDSTNTVHSVEKALVILETLSRVEEMGISELSRELGLGKATIYRIITTLRIHGYVEQTATEKYKLNFKLFEIGNRVVNQIGIRKTARPFLEQLAVATKETVNLAVLDYYTVIYIDRIESREPLRIGLDVGTRFPAFCTALGLSMLAYMNLAEVDNLLEQTIQNGLFIKHTENPVIDLHAVKKQLLTIREQGYSLDDEYYLSGIRGVAAPIFNHAGQIKAAISVAGPAVRMTDEVMAKFVPKVKVTARDISVRLGYSG